MENYIEVNKQLWNKKVPIHVDSDFYDLKGFLAGKQILNSIELNLLKDIKGKKILHLQCHFGMDSIALAQLGAEVVGVDFSELAIKKANEIAQITNANASFICCDIYSLPEVFNEKFDIVFTSYGTIGWLPDLNKWAKVIQHFLNVNGAFIMADFHPFIWMWDNDFEKIGYHYFNVEPIIETLEGTYANKNSDINETEIGWNHPISEILNALISTGLNLKEFNEFNYSPYNCFNNTVEIAPNQFQIKTLVDKVPYVYALKAIK